MTSDEREELLHEALEAELALTGTFENPPKPKPAGDRNKRKKGQKNMAEEDMVKINEHMTLSEGQWYVQALPRRSSGLPGNFLINNLPEGDNNRHTYAEVYWDGSGYATQRAHLFAAIPKIYNHMANAPAPPEPKARLLVDYRADMAEWMESYRKWYEGRIEALSIKVPKYWD